MSIGPDAIFVAEAEAEGKGGATVGAAFLLSRFEFATGFTGLLAGGLAAGGLAAGGLVAGGLDVGFATGCDVGAAPGWTILTTFSSR